MLSWKEQNSIFHGSVPSAGTSCPRLLQLWESPDIPSQPQFVAKPRLCCDFCSFIQLFLPFLPSSVQSQGSSGEASTPFTVKLRGCPSNITEASLLSQLGREAQGHLPGYLCRNFSLFTLLRVVWVIRGPSGLSLCRDLFVEQCVLYIKT